MQRKRILNFMVDESLVSAIDNFRYLNKIPTRAEAARELINKGVATEKEEFVNLEKRRSDTKAYFMPKWVMHSYINHSQIRRDLYNLTPKPLLDRFVGKYKDDPAIITGSGSTLDDSIPFLKEWKGILICGITQLETLWYHGIRPHMACIFDSGGQTAKHFNYKELGYKGVTLTADPTIDPEAIKKWKGDKAYYITQGIMQSYKLASDKMTVGEFVDKFSVEPSDRMSWYTKEPYEAFTRIVLPMAYTDEKRMNGGIHMRLFAAGSTANNEIQMASLMGCKPIGMIGNDLSIQKGYPYKATKWRYKDGEWHGHSPPNITGDEPNSGWRSHKTAALADNGLNTTKEFMGYKVSLIVLSFQADNQIFELGHHRYGAINYFPKPDSEEFIKRQGKGYEDLYVGNGERFTKANEYFTSHGYGALGRPEWFRADGTIDHTKLGNESWATLEEIKKI